MGSCEGRRSCSHEAAGCATDSARQGAPEGRGERGSARRGATQETVGTSGLTSQPTQLTSVPSELISDPSQLTPLASPKYMMLTVVLEKGRALGNCLQWLVWRSGIFLFARGGMKPCAEPMAKLPLRWCVKCLVNVKHILTATYKSVRECSS